MSLSESGRRLTTLAQTRRQLVCDLMAAGIEESEAKCEAELILAHVTGYDTAQRILHAEELLSDGNLACVAAILDSRRRRIPLQYVLGEAPFMGLLLAIEAGVFIPRADTETLVTNVISLIEEKFVGAVRLGEIGIGSGAIAVSLLVALPECKIFASDICPQAAALADKNARVNKVADRLQISCGDWRQALPVNLHGIYSNPPYIPRNLSSTLAPEVVGHEPHAALFGSGDDGLGFYRDMADLAPQHLLAGGFLAVEVGDGAGAEVCRILAERGWQHIRTFLDMNGFCRVVTASTQ